MAIRVELSCDGCGHTVFIEPGSSSMEIRKECMVSLNGAGDEKYDLCTRCQDRLAEAVNPKKWPRAAKAAA